LVSIGGKYISVWAFVNGAWKVYDPNNPGFSDLTTMEPDYGYWINASEASIWTMVDCVPTLISPATGAVMDNGCNGQSNEIVWDFDWSDCSGADKYHLYVIGPTATYPVVDDSSIISSSYQYVSLGVIADQFRLGWRWRVRAEINGVWGEWSDERTFDVEPYDTDCPIN